MENRRVSKIRNAFPKKFSPKLPAQVKIVFINPEESRKLNLIYRGKKNSANVLSFRYGQDYGELLIAREIVRADARRSGRSVTRQMTWMIVHGMLHLAGLHHEKSLSDDIEFKRLEKAILDKLYIFNKFPVL